MRILIALIVISSTTYAAPIPKSLKAKKPFDITGMWKLVECDSNGQQIPVEGMIRYWKFSNDQFEYYKDEKTKMDEPTTTLITPDSVKPHLKMMGPWQCFFLRDDSRMVWVYSNDLELTLHDCNPGPKRQIKVFELVK